MPETHLQIGPIVQYVTALTKAQTSHRTPITAWSTRPAEGSRMAQNRLAILLAVDRDFGSGEQRVLDTTLFKVSSKHRASAHDPRRVLMGTLTPALVANGWLGLVIWGAPGAVCGGVCTYYSIHHATKAELSHIGKRLTAKSSAC